MEPGVASVTSVACFFPSALAFRIRGLGFGARGRVRYIRFLELVELNAEPGTRRNPKPLTPTVRATSYTGFNPKASVGYNKTDS